MTSHRAAKSSPAHSLELPGGHHTSFDSAHTPQSDSPARRHNMNFGKFSLGLLAAVATIHFLTVAKVIMFPIMLALVFFFLLSPLVRSLMRFRVPESIAAAVVVLTASLLIGGVAYLFIPRAANWVVNVPNTLQEARHKLAFVLEPMEQIDEASDKVSEITDSDKGTIKVAVEEPTFANDVLNITFSFVAGATITVVLTYMLLAVGRRTSFTLASLLHTHDEDQTQFLNLLRDVERGVSHYLTTITAINTGLGLVIGTVLWLLGYPDPLILGIMATMLNYIPFVGCLIGTTVTFLIGVVNLDETFYVIAGPACYFAINTLEGNVVTPMVLGSSMKLNPAVVFLGIVFWGWIWGIGGILIAVPLLGIVKIVCDHLEHSKPVGRVLAVD